MVELTLLGGLVGGLLATIPVTVFMTTLRDDSPPPTALFWAKYIGDNEPDAYIPQGMALHVLYVTGGGVVLAAVLPALGFGDVALVTALGAGLATGSSCSSGPPASG